MKAAVLGIGTELTDGQIVNKNASWISGKLKDLGLTTACHLVVPDERRLMLEGIDHCARYADLIFITGGLGPTSDDFTRDIVATWAKKSLVFDEASWEHITERLTSRGYTVKKIQRQQCYFPEGAHILHNSEGTANGFQLEVGSKKLFVLPGPPREINAIWNTSVKDWLDKNTQNIDPYLTYKWDTIGVGESDVAIIVEETLKGIEVDKGYRVHLPYVEVKLSFLLSKKDELQDSFDKLTQALKFCTVTRDGEDVTLLLAHQLESVKSLQITDSVTGQFLLNRLMPALRDFMITKDWSFRSSFNPNSNADLKFELTILDEMNYQASLEYKGKKLSESIVSPYKTSNMRERSQQYLAEMALIFWQRNISKLSSD